METSLASVMQTTPAVKSVQTLFDNWIDYIDAAPATAAAYTRAIRQFRNYLDLQGITAPQRADVLAFRESLKAAGRKPATVQAYIQSIRLFFQWTEQNGLYNNIAAHVKGAKLEQEHKRDYLTARQAGKLLISVDRSTIGGKRDYAILVTMLTSGLRTIEIVRADIGDMRTVADFLALYVQGKGREEKSEYVKIVEEAESAIREYLKARREQGGILQDTSPLFASVANRNCFKRLTTRSISRLVKKHLRDIGIDDRRHTAHSLRHTAATLNLLNGGTVEETQQLLRHSNINTTMIYSHALERAKNNSEKNIASAIFGKH